MRRTDGGGVERNERARIARKRGSLFCTRTRYPHRFARAVDDDARVGRCSPDGAFYRVPVPLRGAAAFAVVSFSRREACEVMISCTGTVAFSHGDEERDDRLSIVCVYINLDYLSIFLSLWGRRVGTK